MEKLKFIHNTIIHWIDKTDSKANIILGIKLFLIGYFLTLLDGFSFGWNWGTVLLILFVINSFVSFIFVVRIIYPKLSTVEASSLIYFKHISDKYKNNKSQGIEDLGNFSDGKFKTDISNQIISLAIVAEEKYRHLQKGIIFMLIEVVVLVFFKFL